MKGTNYEAMTMSPCTFNCSIFSYINKHKEWSIYGFFVTKMLTSTLHWVSSLDFANACDLWADKFVGWECVIVRYNLLIYIFSTTLPCFFLGGGIDIKSGCIFRGTTEDLSSGPKLHTNLMQKKPVIIDYLLIIIIIVGLVSNDGLL